MGDHRVRRGTEAPSQGAPLRANARWWGGGVFEAQVRDHRITFDAAGRDGVAAMEGLLGSLASGLGAAILAVLAARRISCDGLEVRVSGGEADDGGPGVRSLDVEVCLTRVDPAEAERVVALAESRHCPVSAVLRRAGVSIAVRTVVPESAGARPAVTGPR